MKRRKFLRDGLSGGALAVAGGLRPRAAADAGPSRAEVGSFELDETTISELQDGLTRGRFTARSLARKYLERIAEIDARGPALRSVIETNPEAVEIAERLDRERKDGRVRGALHGVPVLVKDNIDTADRMKTTAGSLAMVDARPAHDAFIVQRLREAGAVIIGKTNLSEWANFRSSHSSSGWSARGGQTKNPYALDRNPCGSSSGSGAAAAASLCAAAVGTETDGSVVCPSSANSLVGMKPTLGLVSRSGIIPIAHSQDTAGPMARTVRDAALLLNALAGHDPRDPASRPARIYGDHSPARPDFARGLSTDALRGARVGVARKFFGFNDKVDKLMADSLDVLKRLGATLVDPADIPTQGQFDASEFEVLLYEFKADLNKYLAATPGAHPRTLKELIKFNEDNREREMPYFGQELFVQSEAKGPLTSRAYLAALRKNHRLARAQGIDAVMIKHRLDAMVAPTGGPPWPTDLLNGDHFSGGFSSAAAVAGYPHVTVPAGYIFGLPVGLSFFGRAHTDARLLGFAYAYEQATKHRRAPKFLPRAEV
ncbi:MAG: amidase [Acidobacteria bacterium]|nr:amidase [Acidobacteriota bacterium]